MKTKPKSFRTWLTCHTTITHVGDCFSISSTSWEYSVCVWWDRGKGKKSRKSGKIALDRHLIHQVKFSWTWTQMASNEACREWWPKEEKEMWSRIRINDQEKLHSYLIVKYFLIIFSKAWRVDKTNKTEQVISLTWNSFIST